jgi:hypothetical protein
MVRGVVGGVEEGTVTSFILQVRYVDRVVTHVVLSVFQVHNVHVSNMNNISRDQNNYYLEHPGMDYIHWGAWLHS